MLTDRLADAVPDRIAVPAETVVATDARTRVRLRLDSLRLAGGWATAVLR